MASALGYWSLSVELPVSLVLKHCCCVCVGWGSYKQVTWRLKVMWKWGLEAEDGGDHPANSHLPSYVAG